MTRITTNAGSNSNTWASEQAAERSGWLARVGDFIELTKPRIVILELVTIVVAAHLASPRGVDAWVLWHTVLGAALVAASAGAFNQWLEAGTDARMRRTATRPLPAGRLAVWQVVLFGTVTLVAGVAELVWFVGAATAAAGIATWLVYVTLYTPLKTRTPLNTAVGAVSGALPILIGWTATGAAARHAGLGARGGDVLVAVSAFHGDRLVVPRRLRSRRAEDADRRGSDWHAGGGARDCGGTGTRASEPRAGTGSGCGESDHLRIVDAGAGHCSSGRGGVVYGAAG